MFAQKIQMVLKFTSAVFGQMQFSAWEEVWEMNSITVLSEWDDKIVNRSCLFHAQ